MASSHMPHTPAQVVGLRNGWQTALVMAGLTTKIHAKRLAQGTEVVLELRSQGAPLTLCMLAPVLSSGNVRVLCGARTVCCAACVPHRMRSVGRHAVNSL